MIKTLFGDKLPWTSFDSPISSSPKDYLREGRMQGGGGGGERGISIWTNGRKRVKCNIVTVMDLYSVCCIQHIRNISLSSVKKKE